MKKLTSLLYVILLVFILVCYKHLINMEIIPKNNMSIGILILSIILISMFYIFTMIEENGPK